MFAIILKDLLFVESWTFSPLSITLRAGETLKLAPEMNAYISQSSVVIYDRRIVESNPEFFQIVETINQPIAVSFDVEVAI